MALDLLVRDVRLRGRQELVDVAVSGGVIAQIAPDLDVDAERVIKAAGRLATPPFVDCHLHPDTALTAGAPRHNESGTLGEGIEIWKQVKSTMTADDVLERGRRIVKWAVARGTLYIRAHADVSGANDASLRALLALRDEVEPLVTIQVSVFPQDGVYSDPLGEERLEGALRRGADCVGGIPHYEPTAELGLREVHRVFELAKAYGADVDIHCDEIDDPQSRFVEVIADNALKYGMHGRATASHCTAMGSYDPAYSAKLHQFLRRAAVNIVCNPFSNALVQGRLDPYPKRRGFTQVKELLQAGVNVSLGTDGVMDPWNPLGDADLLNAAFLGLHFTYMSGLAEVEEMLELATTRGARTLGVEDEYGIEEGKPASFVVFDASTPLEAIRLRSARRWVVRRGRVVAETTPAETRLYVGDDPPELVDFSGPQT